MGHAKTFLLAMVVVAIFATTTAHASNIKSRDFGSDDAQLLMRLAQAELGDADAEDKATLMLQVLERVWTPQNPISIEQAIQTGNYRSVNDGSYNTAQPDAQSKKAIELIYSGFNGKQNETKAQLKRIVQTLEYIVPMLFINLLITLLTLISMALQNLQDFIGRH